MRLQYPETQTSHLRVAYKRETHSADTTEHLQAKIIELEGRLKKQQETVDKGTKLMQIVYGDKFETDFLF